MLVGYARVSTEDQSLDVQLDALKAAGCGKVFSEKLSGTTMRRPQLVQVLEFCREGDVLLVTRLDRFARSSVDLHIMVEQLMKKGVGFRCVEQGGIDTTTIHGELMLGVLGAVAQFETKLRSERQREGIEQAKRKGVYKGRRATIDPVAVRRLLDEGKKPVEVARELGCNRASVYRLAG
jgi:DNA invertase Pin-like site-specific DNA recombinase